VKGTKKRVIEKRIVIRRQMTYIVMLETTVIEGKILEGEIMRRVMMKRIITRGQIIDMEQVMTKEVTEGEIIMRSGSGTGILKGVVDPLLSMMRTIIFRSFAG
jgi:hypothetical protein